MARTRDRVVVLRCAAVIVVSLAVMARALSARHARLQTDSCSSGPDLSAMAQFWRPWLSDVPGLRGRVEPRSSRQPVQAIWYSGPTAYHGPKWTVRAEPRSRGIRIGQCFCHRHCMNSCRPRTRPALLGTRRTPQQSHVSIGRSDPPRRAITQSWTCCATCITKERPLRDALRTSVGRGWPSRHRSPDGPLLGLAPAFVPQVRLRRVRAANA